MKKFGLIIVLLVAVLGCQSHRAPVVGGNQSAAPAPEGFHRVAAGENLYRIGLRYGHTTAQLLQWNNISDADQIGVGQLIRVTAPASGKTVTTAQSSAGAPSKKSTAALTKLNLIWPVRGKVSRSDNGIRIAVPDGSEVRAAADGNVVYADDGTRGYGNMILLRHPDNIITAYAHNSVLLVKNGQKVKKGAIIAKSGTGPDGRQALYFALSADKKFVDPRPYLH